MGTEPNLKDKEQRKKKGGGKKGGVGEKGVPLTWHLAEGEYLG